MTEEFFTISELNIFIKDVINAGFPQPLWICGEIQGFDRNKNKNHIFFELVEKDTDSKDVVARIGVVIFANRKNVINEILKKSENAFSLKDDIEVKFACKIDFYAPHGAVRLIIESIDPVYTLGKLAQERQKLIALLKGKGVLDKNKQLQLSSVPLNVGLITSDDSAAYNDFLSELKRSGYGFKIFLRNTLMQGKKAEADVCRAFNELHNIHTLDVIVVTRGGGSIAELSCFDSEKIAEKIAHSAIPVLSGIGHEINTTVTDLAAHTYAKTPTAIAQFLVQKVQFYLENLEERYSTMIDAMHETLEKEKQRLKESVFDLQKNTNQFLKGHHEKIIRLTEILKQRPLLLLNSHRKEFLRQREELVKAIKNRFQSNHQQVHHYQKVIDVLDPRNTLKRGFSITRSKGGRILKSIASVDVQDELITELKDGALRSFVKDKKTKEV